MASIREKTFILKARRLCPTATIESDGSRIYVRGSKYNLRAWRIHREGEDTRVENFYLQRNGDQPEVDLFLGTFFDSATSALRALSTW
jgi:hypothetical protein